MGFDLWISRLTHYPFGFLSQKIVKAMYSVQQLIIILKLLYIGLKSLVQTYVSAICSGELPCMENAVLTLAQIENSAAVQKAITYYEEQMNQKIHMPTETLQELLDLHRPIESEAIEVFLKNSFKDVDQKFQTELGVGVLPRNHKTKENMDHLRDEYFFLVSKAVTLNDAHIFTVIIEILDTSGSCVLSH